MSDTLLQKISEFYKHRDRAHASARQCNRLLSLHRIVRRHFLPKQRAGRFLSVREYDFVFLRLQKIKV